MLEKYEHIKWQNLLSCDHDLFGLGIAPLSKKLDVKKIL
jgi:hypothetical protein